MTIKLYDKDNSPKVLDDIAKVLNDGGVVIIPTDTTYAFACNALQERAVEKICSLRSINPAKHPLSIICYDISAISKYAKIPTSVFKVMKRNLPGPFTFILAGLSKLPKIFRNRKGSEVGIRMPDCEPLREIMGTLGKPLMTASLQLPNESDDIEYLTNPELVNEAFGKTVDLVIDCGNGKLGQSTIIDCTGEQLEIVRQGDGELLL